MFASLWSCPDTDARAGLRLAIADLLKASSELILFATKASLLYVEKDSTGAWRLWHVARRALLRRDKLADSLREMAR